MLVLCLFEDLSAGGLPGSRCVGRLKKEGMNQIMHHQLHGSDTRDGDITV